MSNLYIHNGNEWCDVCSNTAKIKVPSGDWVQIGKGSEINKYYNGTEWVILECPNECPDVTIGSQIWTRCNLGVTTYRNGETIPQVSDPTAWADLTTGAWRYYNNDPSTEPLYGKLYNWHAVNDPRGLALDGYHIPTDGEVLTLSDYLGGDLVAGSAMKETGTTHWIAPNVATNSSGFTALPAGYCVNGGTFASIGSLARWWTSTEISSTDGGTYDVDNSDPNLFRLSYEKNWGHSVRLVKGDAPIPDPCPNCVSGDITIGTQVWDKCNLDVTTYRNGDVIPEVQDPAVWASLTTGAWCWYNNDSANGPTYGKLYNWHAVNDPRELAPVGYHVPTDTELTTLTDYLGGSTVAGGAMKEVGLCHWNSPNINATNSSGFTALPGGTRNDFGSYDNIGNNGNYWSSSEFDTTTAWLRSLNLIAGNVDRFRSNKENGFSVRVIKD
jgi:uncharacterized protein (TIGR02145 family)